MTKFQNLKIAITDNDHLKDVCDVLESIGYVLRSKCSKSNYVFASYLGFYWIDINNQPVMNDYEATLSDLLKLRDEMVKHKAKSSQE